MEKQIGILISDELGGALCTTSGLGPRAADAARRILIESSSLCRNENNLPLLDYFPRNLPFIPEHLFHSYLGIARFPFSRVPTCLLRD